MSGALQRGSQEIVEGSVQKKKSRRNRTRDRSNVPSCGTAASHYKRGVGRCTMASSQSFHILVTDTNHHVRNLLRRELEGEGYITHSVSNCTSAHSRILSSAPLDLIILDPELFRPEHLDLFYEILQHAASTPVILHTYSDTVHSPNTDSNIYFIAKNAESIHRIKETIRTLCSPSS